MDFKQWYEQINDILITKNGYGLNDLPTCIDVDGAYADGLSPDDFINIYILPEGSNNRKIEFTVEDAQRALIPLLQKKQVPLHDDNAIKSALEDIKELIDLWAKSHNDYTKFLIDINKKGVKNEHH